MLNKIIKLLGGHTQQEYNQMRNTFVEIRQEMLITRTYMKGVDEMLARQSHSLSQVELLLNDQYRLLSSLEEIKEVLRSNTFQNKFDFTKKKRGWKGLWKLTEAQIEEIKNSKDTQEALATKYGVSRSRIGAIKRTGK